MVADSLNNKTYLYIDGSLAGLANYKNPTSTTAKVFSI
jgi:hypothetical protein